MKKYHLCIPVEREGKVHKYCRICGRAMKQPKLQAPLVKLNVPIRTTPHIIQSVSNSRQTRR